MKDMFSERVANFSGISANDQLYVSYVVQKAFIEVDEEGAEAAAASAAVVTLFESAGPAALPFVANHPFIFYLRYKNFGMLLFQGRITDPQIHKEANTKGIMNLIS